MAITIIMVMTTSTTTTITATITMITITMRPTVRPRRAIGADNGTMSCRDHD